MSKEYVIAYDFGTSGVKAVLVDTSTRIIGMATADYPMMIPRDGWAEQDPEEYWESIIESTQNLLADSRVSNTCIKAIVFSTQAMGIIPIDDNGDVLYNNISWVDGRAQAQAAKINHIMGKDIFGPKSVLSKLLWIKEERPEMFRKTKYFLDVNGFLKYKATGQNVTEMTGACSYRLDLHNKCWDKDVFEMTGIGLDKLPQIVSSTDLIGYLTPKAAQSLGLCTETAVIAGCNDVESAAIGAAAIGEGEAHIYLGSSAWLCASTSKFVDVKNGVTISRSPDSEKYLLKGVTQSSGMTVDKAIDLLYSYEKKNENINEFMVIEEEVSKVNPGSDRLIITPWIFGETCPVTNENVHSTVFNMTNMHTRAHIIKAIREGIGFNLRWTRDNFKKDFNMSFPQLNIIGGGGLSDDWIQTLADILQIPLCIAENQRHAGAVGAAVCAMVGCGIYKDFNCVKEIIKIKKKFTPREKNSKIYDTLFNEYKNLYSTLLESYERVNSISNKR